MDMFRPKHCHSRPDVRKEAVAKLKDVDVLFGVLNCDSEADVRLSAAARLVELYVFGSPRGLALIKEIQDPCVLVYIAVNDRDPEACWWATNSLRDGRLLAEVAKSARREETALQALEKIEGKSLVSEVAMSTAHVGAKSAALRRAENQSVLLSALGPAISRRVRCAALTNLRDRSFLETAASADQDAFVRWCAKLRLQQMGAQGGLKDSKFTPLNYYFQTIHRDRCGTLVGTYFARTFNCRPSGFDLLTFYEDGVVVSSSFRDDDICAFLSELPTLTELADGKRATALSKADDAIPGLKEHDVGLYRVDNGKVDLWVSSGTLYVEGDWSAETCDCYSGEKRDNVLYLTQLQDNSKTVRPFYLYTPPD